MRSRLKIQEWVLKEKTRKNSSSSSVSSRVQKTSIPGASVLVSLSVRKSLKDLTVQSVSSPNGLRDLRLDLESS